MSQDNKSLLACYKLFDKYLTEKSVTRPVVLLSDGHGSRFDYDILTFCHEKSIRLFISPPDTTGVTQMLDQCNQRIHSEYRKAKANLFTSMMTINRESFIMVTLADMWDKWGTPDTLKKAAKKVGISANGLNVHDMQNEKFIQAENCIQNSDPSTSDGTPKDVPLIASPAKYRRGSALY